MEGIVHRFYYRISEQLFTEQLHMAVYKNNEAEIGCSYHVCSSLLYVLIMSPTSFRVNLHSIL